MSVYVSVCLCVCVSVCLCLCLCFRLFQRKLNNSLQLISITFSFTRLCYTVSNLYFTFIGFIHSKTPFCGPSLHIHIILTHSCPFNFVFFSSFLFPSSLFSVCFCFFFCLCVWNEYLQYIHSLSVVIIYHKVWSHYPSQSISPRHFHFKSSSENKQPRKKKNSPSSCWIECDELLKTWQITADGATTQLSLHEVSFFLNVSLQTISSQRASCVHLSHSSVLMVCSDCCELWWMSVF